MTFQESLMYYLSSENNLSTKQIFDLAIKCAQEEDPDFVKLYNWPVNTAERQLTSSTPNASTSDYDVVERYSGPVDWRNVEFLGAYARTMARRAEFFSSADYFDYFDYYDDDEYDDYKEEQYNEYKDVCFSNK
ncbi:hypothetical protein BDF21DRAFT_401959 [Thamnidium elegans]|nr:hypothetical protein BDF21DRAFT_401959 [Thamnidium elegans]